MAGRVNVLQGPRDEDLPGGGGHRYTETGVDRTPPRGGNATAGTSAGSTAAAERWTETKRRGPPRSGPGSDPPLTDRPLTPGEASTTGVAKRALALEPGRFRYAYRTGRAARRGDVTRSIENRMETITSMAQARGDALSSSRTSRLDTHKPRSQLTPVLSLLRPRHPFSFRSEMNDYSSAPSIGVATFARRKTSRAVSPFALCWSVCLRRDGDSRSPAQDSRTGILFLGTVNPK